MNGSNHHTNSVQQMEDSLPWYDGEVVTDMSDEWLLTNYVNDVVNYIEDDLFGPAIEALEDALYSNELVYDSLSHLLKKLKKTIWDHVRDTDVIEHMSYDYGEIGNLVDEIKRRGLPLPDVWRLMNEKREKGEDQRDAAPPEAIGAEEDHDRGDDQAPEADSRRDLPADGVGHETPDGRQAEG